MNHVSQELAAGQQISHALAAGWTSKREHSLVRLYGCPFLKTSGGGKKGKKK